VTVLLRLALRNLWRNPRRTALTMGAMIVAVVLTLLFESMGAGTHKRWVEAIVRLYPGHVEVMARGYREQRTLDYGFQMLEAQEDALEHLAGVDGWAPRVESWALAMPDREGALGRAAWLVGVEPERERAVTKLVRSVQEGRFLDGEARRTVVLGAGLARGMKVGVGEDIILLSTDYYGSQAADRFRVVGTISVGNPQFDNAMALLRLDRMREFLDYGDQVSHVAVFAEHGGGSHALAARIGELFQASDYEVLAWPELLPDLAQLSELDDVANRLNLLILILLAGFGLLNTVLMSVFERVREFGVLRAMGARRSMLFGLVLLEASLLAVLGIFIGLGIGLPIELWLEASPIPVSGRLAEVFEVFHLEPVIVFDLERKNLIGTPLIMFGVGVLASVPAAIRASRGQPIDAIRTATT
jgi:ABC-type lipoprotein release transport system permease subunit